MKPRESENVAIYDATMVHRILLSLYEEKDDRLQERLRLSPPEMGKDSDEMLRHVDRMVEVGLIHRTHEFHMRPPPDPVTIRPTPAAAEWARIALDDELWEQKKGQLLKLLVHDEN